MAAREVLSTVFRRPVCSLNACRRLVSGLKLTDDSVEKELKIPASRRGVEEGEERRAKRAHDILSAETPPQTDSGEITVMYCIIVLIMIKKWRGVRWATKSSLSRMAPKYRVMSPLPVVTCPP